MELHFFIHLRNNKKDAVCLLCDEHYEEMFTLEPEKTYKCPWALKFKNVHVQVSFQLLDGQVHIFDKDANLLKLPKGSLAYVLSSYTFPLKQTKSTEEEVLERIGVYVKHGDTVGALKVITELQALLLKKLSPQINA